LCECNTVKNPKKTNADFDAETKRKKVSWLHELGRMWIGWRHLLVSFKGQKPCYHLAGGVKVRRFALCVTRQSFCCT
jgi:hypothetical protein